MKHLCYITFFLAQLFVETDIILNWSFGSLCSTWKQANLDMKTKKKNDDVITWHDAWKPE
jgi:hypothetical protein